MMRALRLWWSRHGGTPVGVWTDAPQTLHYRDRMRRLLPSGEFEYRRMTEDEKWDSFSRAAW